ncbi:MAG: metal-dependent transcriptional regulator [Oscillospiraceae bacterium]|jgi:Mn-dependent DtxR family transcriptional regulator|nr:metal-dependent transcriptional regulator [Oscillospiraceae bacterium]
MKIRESAENYLETILILSYKNPVVRSIDIANELEYSKPSVSVAMKNLRENGYIKMDADMYITLTEKGQAIAEKMYERHVFISNWLTELGVDRAVAAKDACRMEHVISDETFEAIKGSVRHGTLESSMP